MECFHRFNVCVFLDLPDLYLTVFYGEGEAKFRTHLKISLSCPRITSTRDIAVGWAIRILGEAAGEASTADSDLLFDFNILLFRLVCDLLITASISPGSCRHGSPSHRP